MEINEKLLNIIKELNDSRSKLSALYSLYNSSLLIAEESRSALGEFYEQMIDCKNNLNLISNDIYSSKKAERIATFTKNKSKIKRINTDVKNISNEFTSSCNKYKLALKECGSLRTEYKHDVSNLCKDFKACITDSTDPLILKGYKQQVRIIKAILDKIELLVSDYNIKRNKMEQDNDRFNELYSSVNTLLEKLQTIA